VLLLCKSRGHALGKHDFIFFSLVVELTNWTPLFCFVCFTGSEDFGIGGKVVVRPKEFRLVITSRQYRWDAAKNTRSLSSISVVVQNALCHQ